MSKHSDKECKVSASTPQFDAVMFQYSIFYLHYKLVDNEINLKNLKPAVASLKPEVVSSCLEVATMQHECSMNNPDVSTTSLNVSTMQPEVVSFMFQRSTKQPEVITKQPAVRENITFDVKNKIYITNHKKK